MNYGHHLSSISIPDNVSNSHLLFEFLLEPWKMGKAGDNISSTDDKNLRLRRIKAHSFIDGDLASPQPWTQSFSCLLSLLPSPREGWFGASCLWHHHRPPSLGVPGQHLSPFPPPLPKSGMAGECLYMESIVGDQGRRALILRLGKSSWENWR